MDNKDQNAGRDLQKECETLRSQIELEIGKRKQAEASLKALTEELAATNDKLISFTKDKEEQLRFDMLVSEISAHFINLPPDQVDRGIVDAQRQICECLGLDISALWQWTVNDPERLLMTHLYRSMAGPPVPEMMDANEFFPWCQQELRSSRLIVVSSMDNLPPEAARDLEAWRQFNIKTSLTIPLSVGNEPPFGGISFNDMRSERNWTELLLKRLKLVAQIFANALSRKRYDENLRQTEMNLSLATDAAVAGLWSLDIATGKVWASPKLRELFCFAADENLSYESFNNVIHPEDRERVRQAVQQVFRSGEYLHIDYRILLPGEQIRWICVRGNRHLNPDGEPDSLMGVSVDITERMMLENQLRENLQEIETLKQRLEKENIFLQSEVNQLFQHTKIVGQSMVLRKVLGQAEQVAPTDTTVLIQGETGTGKELLARAIHSLSSRNHRPMVTVNCASLPPTLVESELFGREKGAYTGALTKMAGRFEIADGSTLFLDEIGELPQDLQSKLLKVLEEGVFERLGSTKPMKVNVRVIAATNRNLNEEVNAGRFRKDLFYRLNVFPITIPPLRERPEDISQLVWSFVKEFQERMGKRIDSIPKRSMEVLQSYLWPGNVRELRNVIERAIILSTNRVLQISIPSIASPENARERSLEDVERKCIMDVLEKTTWRISGKGGAAEVLGVKRTTLQAKMKKLGIQRPTR